MPIPNTLGELAKYVGKTIFVAFPSENTYQKFTLLKVDIDYRQNLHLITLEFGSGVDDFWGLYEYDDEITVYSEEEIDLAMLELL